MEKEFERFGRIKSVTMKGHYAFVDFEDHAAAKKALELHNTQFVNGETLVVEQSSTYLFPTKPGWPASCFLNWFDDRFV